MSVKPSDEYMHRQHRRGELQREHVLQLLRPHARASGALRAHRQPAERALRGDDDRRLPAGRHGAVQLQAARDRRQQRLRRRRHALRRRASRSSICSVVVRRRRPSTWRSRSISRIRARAFTSNPHQPVSLDARLVRPQPDVRRRGAASTARWCSRSGHYEQHGRAVGTLDRRRHRARASTASACAIIRGVRARWQSPAYYRWLIGQFDDGFGFMGSQIVTQAGSELLSGFVFQRRREPLRRTVLDADTPTGSDPGHYHDRARPDPAQQRRRRRDQRARCITHAAAAQPPRRQGDAHQRRPDRVALRRPRRLRLVGISRSDRLTTPADQ